MVTAQALLISNQVTQMFPQSIIKDSFYKTRLLQSGLNSITGSSQQGRSLKGLSQTLIRQGLKDFQKSVQDDSYAFTTFVCNHQQIESIDILATYIYLCNLDVSNNSIANLRALSSLRYLVNLNASQNKLTNILDHKFLPHSLETVDLSYNQIQNIPDLHHHKYLQVLNLKGNKINSIRGLSRNSNLRVLNLSENQIENIEGLNDLNLTDLDLSRNKISFIKGLSKLGKLRTLDLSNNSVAKLPELSSLLSLRHLYLSKNLIEDINQILSLQNMSFLELLDLCFNPIQQKRYYRHQVLYRLPMLQTLDGTRITAVQVVKSENVYGMDVQARAEIFREILPEQEFVDRRIHISQLIEAETEKGDQERGFVDRYDQDSKIVGQSNKDRSFSNSKSSILSKASKLSKLSKPSGKT